MGFKEFESRVRNDSAFAAKFKGINDPAAVIALAKAEGYNLSMSDFSEELSDEELDNVAGGANVNEGANDRGPKDKNRTVVAVAVGVVAVVPFAVAVAS